MEVCVRKQVCAWCECGETVHPGRALAPAGPACLGVGTLGQAGSRKCPRALGMDAELLVHLIGRASAYSDLVISVLHHDQWASQLSLLWAGEVAGVGRGI